MKLYGYYSWGGYKDMCFGELDSNCKSVYFLPLLNIMRNRNRPEEKEKIVWLETLPSIGIMRQGKDYGFPHECSTLFSHGGFSAIYQALSSGRTCLTLRDIVCSTQDEEGRSTPFTLLFLAESEEDIALLDNTAHYCLKHLREAHVILSSVMVFDIKANGLRADIYKVKEWIDGIGDCVRFIHHPNRISYLMIPSLNMLSIVLDELKISQNRLDAVVFGNGQLCKGQLQVRRNQTIRKNTTIEEVPSGYRLNSNANHAILSPQEEDAPKLPIQDPGERLNDEMTPEHIDEPLDSPVMPLSPSQNQTIPHKDDTLAVESCSYTSVSAHELTTSKGNGNVKNIWQAIYEWLRKISRHPIYPYLLLIIGFLIGLIF